MTALIHAAGIGVHRAGSQPLCFPDIDIHPGDRILLLGPSGSGKTTWLSVLSGLLTPDEGRVYFEGRDIYGLNGRSRDRLRGRHFGFVFQTLHLMPHLTLRQNILLAADMAGLTPDRERADDLITRLGLAGKAHRRPHALSQGEQQRAAIARAVLNRPSVILADEPTSALDDENTGIVADILEEQALETGAALVVASHDSRLIRRFTTIVTVASLKEAA